MLSIGKLLSKEEVRIRLPEKRRMKIQTQTYLCKECGHLYYYKIIKCPLCESRDTVVVNNRRKDVVQSANAGSFS
ncbi:MAG: hypothetical protein J4400_02475 [Candidatus Aenigmarchaeota archaeon]|nr:hypothetical protein [Candidatus Aenigmarchaeota archaeon]